MICPHCNKNNSENAKFCGGCGAKLAPVQMMPVQEQQGQAIICSNCGKMMDARAKFCASCGTPVKKESVAEQQIPVQPSVIREEEVVATPVIQEEEAVATPVIQEEEAAATPAYQESEETVLLSPGQSEGNSEATVLLNQADSGMDGGRQENIAPNPPVREKDVETGKKGSVLVPVLIILIVLLLIAACGLAVVFFVPNVKDKLFHTGSEVVETTDHGDEDDEAETEETEEDSAEIPEEELEDLADLIKEAEDQLEEENYGDEDGSVALLESAMQKCVEFAENYAESDDLADLAEKAFSDYTETISAENKLLIGQDMLPELYEQMRSNLNGGMEQAEKLQGAGFDVDTDKLEEKLEELKDDYRDRYIERFNEFTEYDTWSRSESWALMSDADSIGLVDYGEMDDPMTQRYAYALARITFKNVENGLSDGSMSEEDAVKEMESVLEDTDYNLFLMQELADHLYSMNEYERAENISMCIDDIVVHIYETQGLDVGYDISYDFFWSFNEFEKDYSVSDENGLTKENHQWIRDYMKDKL